MTDETETPAERAERYRRVGAALGAYKTGRIIRGEDGAPDRVAPYADVQALWESLWEVCDFSWGGLADAGWDRGDGGNFSQRLKQWRAPADLPGNGATRGTGKWTWKEASLQDFWRFSRGSGGEWQKATNDELLHTGLLTQINGTPWHTIHRHDVRAFDNRQLSKALMERLRAASGFRENAPDHRCQLTGARAMGVVQVWRHYAQSGQSDGQTEPPTLHLRADLAEFRDIKADGLHFGDWASFETATFGSWANFERATFSGFANFTWATFGDRTRFENAIFDGQTSFERATFGDRASFTEATFGDHTHFKNATFGNQTDFTKATFSGQAIFMEAKFGGQASFMEAKFSDWADFERVHFSDGASFLGATFSDEANFTKATFGNQTSFFGATFSGRANFIKATLQGWASWYGVEFKDVANFIGTRWNPEIHYPAAFEAARFRDLANFKTDNFSAFAAFDGATFERTLLLEDPSGEKKPQDLFKAACKAVPTWVEQELKEQKNPDPEKELRRRAWSGLAGGYRTAKKAMGAQGDRDREQRYFRFEIEAQLKRPSTTRAEKIAAGIYREVSDFGASIDRPLFSLAALMVLFTGIYMIFATCLNLTAVASQALWQAVEFSLNNTFRPLFALAIEAPPEGVDPHRLAGKLLFSYGGGWGALVRLLVILQSLASLTLLFLFGLAVRRKFQMS